MTPARKHHGDNVAYELLVEAARSVESKAFYMYEGEMTDAQCKRAADMALTSLQGAAKQIIERLSRAGYDFGPPYDLFKDASSSLDRRKRA